ncbi:2-C-methyl-D-erythritol 4-phosphate cytidylyltransferase [Candidatus Gracilibacteria bacterium]|nr:2-C-methyl-D-erythritol 4-phosphate cytidylyltransferase [Candidatus Gracilibacteria bacterium]
MAQTLLLAAGQSTRLNQDKTLVEIAGKPLIYYPISAFNDHPEITNIIIVANKTNRKAIKQIVKQYRFKKVQTVTLGGQTRQESFAKGFAKIAKTKDLILVHNAANPLISQEEITAIIEAATTHGAAILGHPLTSTIKEIRGPKIHKTHDRNKLFAAQTPQAADYPTFQKALQNAAKHQLEVTDESMLLEAIGQKVSVLPAHEHNFKITTVTDLLKLRAILGETPTNYRIGIGQDSHQFDEALGLTLAGLHFPEYQKLKANSDGDVILHAIFNALSQAIGDKSLGFYADPLFAKGITDSQKYLTPLLQKIHKQKLQINTIGLMLECKIPQIDPLNNKLKTSLAAIFQIPKTRIGITATSGEQLTSFGQGLGIQCFAIVSLTSKSD